MVLTPAQKAFALTDIVNPANDGGTSLTIFVIIVAVFVIIYMNNKK